MGWFTQGFARGLSHLAPSEQASSASRGRRTAEVAFSHATDFGKGTADERKTAERRENVARSAKKAEFRGFARGLSHLAPSEQASSASRGRRTAEVAFSHAMDFRKVTADERKTAERRENIARSAKK